MRRTLLPVSLLAGTTHSSPQEHGLSHLRCIVMLGLVSACSFAQSGNLAAVADRFTPMGKPSAATQKWMTGDWHQHTFFTDGTNFMGDVEIDFSTTPPTVKIIDKYVNASPNFTPRRDPKGKNEYKGVMAQGFRYGLDFQANSEHGGNRGSRDGFGRLWQDTAFYPAGVNNLPILGDVGYYSNGCSYLTVDSPVCPSGSAQVMWRWQELANYPRINAQYGDNYMSAFDWITTLRGQFGGQQASKGMDWSPRAHEEDEHSSDGCRQDDHDCAATGKQIMTGMEWNVPGHEHSSTGCLENDGKCIAEFEYRFDANDTDMTGPALAGMNWSGKILTADYTAANGHPDYSAVLGLKPAHEKAVAGLSWMNTKHPNTAWVNIAHIERAGCGTAQDSGYSVAALRDMNNTAPTVFFGFEGMPGHQKAAARGELSATACGGGTYGGAGAYIATAGGVWDNLLADGRKIFNFVNSDFHITQDDFYPGEYAKTYINVTSSSGKFTQQEIVDSMRSGNSYAVHGDLINALDFRVAHGSSGQDHGGRNSATMGETLIVEKGDRVTIQIRFKSPKTNNCQLANCAKPVVDHVQLIQGRLRSTRASKFTSAGLPNPDFNTVDSTIATIVGTFDASSWKKDEDGFTTITYTVPRVTEGMFFRIRGTNLGKGVNVISNGQTVYGTDAAGSPLKNTPGINSADAVWQDLWFYSNPIFVSVH